MGIAEKRKDTFYLLSIAELGRIKGRPENCKELRVI